MPHLLNVAGYLTRLPTDHAFAGDRDKPNALAASEQHLAAALRQIDLLLQERTRLQQEVLGLAQAVARASLLAHHDELTGLPNRTLLLDRFRQAMALAARQRKQVALLFLDLDHFKRINDTFGHAAGDRVLQQVAQRLASCIRASDTACRYGGDEFVVLLPELEGRQSAIAVAAKIRAHLTLPYLVGSTAIEMTTSVGIAFYPDDGTECGDLIQVSDLAMYRNKGRGPHTSRIAAGDTPRAGLTDSAEAGKTAHCRSSAA
jgi:diguanylate cyclase (GGDEF)-like protein